MKKDIHPVYNKITVTCNCGNKFETGSTAEAISVEICSKCHPFWTGAQRFIDTEKRVDKFKRKQELGESERKKRIQKIKEKVQKEKEKEDTPKTLKDMLKAMQ
jgi:large subunit ribosomal protein L31